MRHLLNLLAGFLAYARDVVPILAVILFFQLAVLRQPLPGTVQGLVGLALFMRGLELALFPAGEGIALARGIVGQPCWSRGKRNH